MDHRRTIIRRTREAIANQMEETLHVIRQHREPFGQGDEPARSSWRLRRAVAEAAAGLPPDAQAAVAQIPFGRGIAEPELEPEREAIQHIVDAGASAVEPLLREKSPDLTAEQILGLEFLWLLYIRPILPIGRRGEMASPPSSWKVIEDERASIDKVLRSVGQIQLLGHPEYDWVGSGFLVGQNCLMTTRQTAEVFAKRTAEGKWQFHPGISAWIDFQAEDHVQTAAACRVLSILGVHQQYDLALLEVESPPGTSLGPIEPLNLSHEPPSQIEGRPAYMVGYPIRDSRRDEPERLANAFRDCYNVKAVHLGRLCGQRHFGDAQLLEHDCAMLGCVRGSCLMDLATHQVLGMHVAGRFLQKSTAIPLWVLRDDPLMRSAGLRFTAAPTGKSTTA